MKRVSLKDQFNGEPDPNQEGISTLTDENDQVILNVVGGAISFVVPSHEPDDKVTQEKYLERFVNCTLQLENGAQLLIWVNSGADGVELQVEPPPRLKKRARTRVPNSEWR